MAAHDCADQGRGKAATKPDGAKRGYSLCKKCIQSANPQARQMDNLIHLPLRAFCSRMAPFSAIDGFTTRIAM